ncbi:thiol reductant ABC exporter subunit CydC [Dermabacteraceae bacterium P7074]
MKRQDSLDRAVALLQIRRSSLVAAVVAATATFLTGYTLAVVSAWLVTTSWTQPPVLTLTVAVVSVRALGISRGVFRYMDRLLTHSTALRGVVELRTGLYSLLADREDDTLFRLRRGDLLARLGNDVDELGDHIIKAVVPALVAAVMAVLVTVSILPFSLFAGISLLLALLFSAVVGPYASYRSAQVHESAALESRGEVVAQTLTVLDDAAALRVQGRLTEQCDQLTAAQESFDAALDRAAWPSAVAQAATPFAVTLAVLGSLWAVFPVWQSGASAGVIGILLLAPLSAFEAHGALAGAASQLARSRAAARRLAAFTGVTEAPTSRAETVGTDVIATSLTTGYSEAKPLSSGIDLRITPGSRIAVVGDSGIGKTTLLLTLAGLVRPLAGSVTLGGVESTQIGTADASAIAVCYAEDAHVFSTTLRENLRVVKHGLTDEELICALAKAGLGDWFENLSDGLDTQLAAGALSLSGGERRRLLLARALLRNAPVTLLDEPTEHMDMQQGDALLHALLTRENGIFSPQNAVVVVTHRVSALQSAPDIIALGKNGILVRGTYADIAAHPECAHLFEES